MLFKIVANTIKISHQELARRIVAKMTQDDNPPEKTVSLISDTLNRIAHKYGGNVVDHVQKLIVDQNLSVSDEAANPVSELREKVFQFAGDLGDDKVDQILRSIMTIGYLLQTTYDANQLAQGGRVLHNKGIRFTGQNTGTFEEVLRDAKGAFEGKGKPFDHATIQDILVSYVQNPAVRTPHPNQLLTLVQLIIAKVVDLCDADVWNGTRTNHTFVHVLDHAIADLEVFLEVQTGHALSGRTTPPDADRDQAHFKPLSDLIKMLKQARITFGFVSEDLGDEGADVPDEHAVKQLRLKLIDALLDSDFVNHKKPNYLYERVLAVWFRRKAFHAAGEVGLQLVTAIHTTLSDGGSAQDWTAVGNTITRLTHFFPQLRDPSWEGSDCDGKPANNERVVGLSVYGDASDFYRYMFEDTVNAARPSDFTTQEDQETALQHLLNLYLSWVHCNERLAPFLDLDSQKKALVTQSAKMVRILATEIQAVYKGDLSVTSKAGLDALVDRADRSSDQDNHFAPELADLLRGSTGKVGVLATLLEADLGYDKTDNPQAELGQNCHRLFQLMATDQGIPDNKVRIAAKVWIQALTYDRALSRHQYRQEEGIHRDTAAEVMRFQALKSPEKPSHLQELITTEQQYRDLQDALLRHYHACTESEYDISGDDQAALAKLATTAYSGSKVSFDISELQGLSGSDLAQKLTQIWLQVRSDRQNLAYEQGLTLLPSLDSANQVVLVRVFNDAFLAKWRAGIKPSDTNIQQLVEFEVVMRKGDIASLTDKEIADFSETTERNMKIMRLIAANPQNFDILLESLCTGAEGYAAMHYLARVAGIDTTKVGLGPLFEEPPAILGLQDITDEIVRNFGDPAVVMLARSDGARTGSSPFELILTYLNILWLVAKGIRVHNGGGPVGYRGGPQHRNLEEFALAALKLIYFTRQGAERDKYNNSQPRANGSLLQDVLLLLKAGIQQTLEPQDLPKIGEDTQAVFKAFSEQSEWYQNHVVQNPDLNPYFKWCTLHGNTRKTSSRTAVRPSIEAVDADGLVYEKWRAITTWFNEVSTGANWHFLTLARAFRAIKEQFGDDWIAKIQAAKEEVPVFAYYIDYFARSLTEKVDPALLDEWVTVTLETLETNSHGLNTNEIRDVKAFVELQKAEYDAAVGFLKELQAGPSQTQTDFSGSTDYLWLQLLTLHFRQQWVEEKVSDGDQLEKRNDQTVMAANLYLLLMTVARRFEAAI